MANPTITINATGITVSGPLIAGEPVAVTASGLSLPEGAALTLALSSRAPNALLASCVLAESEETPGTWTGTLETASRQMAVYFATAAADDTRPAVLELVETTTRDSLALLVTSIRNSALIPSSSPCAVAPVYLPGKDGTSATVAVGETTTLPPGSTATVENVGTASAAVFNFGIPKGEHGTSIPLPVSVANGGTGATTTAEALANLGAVGKTGDTSLTGDYKTTGLVNADAVVANTGIAAGDATAEPPEPTVIIGHQGVIISSNGDTFKAVATPGGKQASDPTNILPVLATNADIANGLATKQDTISDLATIRSGAAAGATAVQPSALAAYRTATAQDAIDSAQDTAIAAKYTKPSSGIPASDLASGVIPSVPSASDVTPQMDGAGSAGRATTYARGDHQHPTDTSRMAATATGVDIIVQPTGQWGGAPIATFAAIITEQVNAKQDTITDLATIRSGAADGATAVQPEDMDEFLYFDPSTNIIKRAGNHPAVANIYLSGGTYGGGYAVNLPELDMGVRYSFASPTPTVSGTSATVACEDRAINDFTVATGITSLTITPPAAVTGRARDFFCRVTLTDSSLPTVTLSGGTIDIGSTEVAGMTQGVNLLMFTEISSGHWLASRRSAS